MMPEGFRPDELSVKQVEAERLRRDKRNIRNAAIEECARMADGFEEAEFGYNPTAVKIAAAIRALKSDASR